MRANRFLVSGVVQGVGYRFFAAHAAGRLGISGYARNLPDGRVEVVAQGDAEALRRFEDDLRTGPGGGRVDGLEVSTIQIDSRMGGFEIRH